MCVFGSAIEGLLCEPSMMEILMKCTFEQTEVLLLAVGKLIDFQIGMYLYFSQSL